MVLEPGKVEIKDISKELIGPPEAPKEAPELVVPEVKEISTREQPKEVPFEAPEKPQPAPPSVAAAVPVIEPVITPIKDEVAQEIENILSEDLTDLFLKMNPQQQEEFRVKGEETASKIRVILSSAKFGVKKILDLISDWLKLIPGVNKFFLEQEAKIKTDKILHNAEEFRKEGKL